MMVPPKNVGVRHFAIQDVIGLGDWIMFHVAPNWLRIPYFAKKVARLIKPVGEPGQDTFSLPGAGIFEILDCDGRQVRPYKSTS